ncbi:hypothetical protein BJV82DRAFT_293166 [Fennellomyces sp. T-0311]|nr:hypothetical protein BJV82DRAFT_293166 [Fennellomyces sp. T-0311]
MKMWQQLLLCRYIFFCLVSKLMEAINELLEDAQLVAIKDAGLTIVSIFGNSGFRTTSSHANGKLSNPNVTLANRIAGAEVFVPTDQTPLECTVEVSKGLQLYVDRSVKTAYIFMDASVDTASLADAYRISKQSDDKRCIRITCKRSCQVNSQRSCVGYF